MRNVSATDTVALPGTFVVSQALYTIRVSS